VRILGKNFCWHDWHIQRHDYRLVVEKRECYKCGKRQERHFIAGQWKWTKWINI
jgi:hypothetical protein